MRTRSVAIHKSREYKMALDNLEQMHPRLLVDLLKSGELRNVLESRVVSYMQTLERLQETYPSTPFENLREIAQADFLPVNPNWQDEEPLTKEERRLLKDFARG